MSTFQEIIDEITGKIAIPEASVYPWDAQRIANTPAVLVGLPDTITYRTTYARSSKLDFTVTVLVGRANVRAATLKLASLLEKEGDSSLFRMVDSQFTDYTTCSDVTVVNAEPDVFRAAGVDYLGAEFDISVMT